MQLAALDFPLLLHLAIHLFMPQNEKLTDEFLRSVCHFLHFLFAPTCVASVERIQELLTSTALDKSFVSVLSLEVIFCVRRQLINVGSQI
jgi:hypothetical protein